jgi:G3E family GTPase
VSTWRVPVIALTGHLGAGKTTVLNHLLRAPGARLGVVVNDFGAINVDAVLVAGQIDEAASIAGGCLCCLPDAGGLDEALDRLTRPQLRLDAVVVEASGIAEPQAVAQLIRAGGTARVRPGGVVDVVDAVEYFRTVDTGTVPPARFAACSLVVINKTDRVPVADRDPVVARIEARVRARNPAAHVVTAVHGRVDPVLVFDAATPDDPPDQLPLAALARAGHDHAQHPRADAVTVAAAGPVEPGRVIDLLEDPPAGAYRIKGTVAVDDGRRVRGYVVHLVGRQIHVGTAPRGALTRPGLVAIGTGLDVPAARARLERALAVAPGPASPDGRRRLDRYRRLSG